MKSSFRGQTIFIYPANQLNLCSFRVAPFYIFVEGAPYHSEQQKRSIFCNGYNTKRYTHTNTYEYEHEINYNKASKFSLLMKMCADREYSFLLTYLI